MKNQSLFESGVSRWFRLVNFLIDIIVAKYVLVNLILSFLITNGMLEENDLMMKSFLINFLVIFLYYFILEIAFGKTLGKVITQTKVVSIFDEKRLSIMSVLTRTATRFIPFEQLTFFGRVGLHDGLSNTKVVFD